MSKFIIGLLYLTISSFHTFLADDPHRKIHITRQVGLLLYVQLQDGLFSTDISLQSCSLVLFCHRGAMQFHRMGASRYWWLEIPFVAVPWNSSRCTLIV